LRLFAEHTAQRTLPDELFTLFGVYGDVVKVKILYNKKDSALVQFANPQAASSACQHLTNTPWRGRHLHVRVPLLSLSLSLRVELFLASR
jgi:hypothetical protein